MAMIVMMSQNCKKHAGQRAIKHPSENKVVHSAYLSIWLFVRAAACVAYGLWVYGGVVRKGGKGTTRTDRGREPTTYDTTVRVIVIELSGERQSN